MTDDPRLGPPPIEPLSDAAWARVERGVWAQLDAERPVAGRGAVARRWWLVAAPLAAAAAIVAVVIAVGRAPEAIDEPSRVVTGAAPSSVLFGDSHIELDAATALVMSHEAEHPIVTLERGAAWFTVAPRQARPAFLVRAGDARVRVVGTRFRVARSGERIAVEVDHGRVEVNFRGGEVAINGGQRWSSDAPARVVASAAPPAEPPPVASPTAAPDPEVPDAPRSPPEPAPAPAHHRPAHHATAPAATAAAPAAPAADRDAAEYDRLAALEATAPRDALSGYLKLANGTSRWADLALFAAGRLAVDRHDARAESLLGDYLRRFPHGANAADARQLLLRLQAAQGDKP
ncbi:MAG TPA: FecR family protein [Kofleriaceae bacterium]|jgi:transmembrane sensor|nr:FecR family protein [Kofleriaceae bacterium]